MNYFQNNILLFVILALTIAFVFSFLINLILLKFAQNLGSRNNPIKDIRWNATTKPSVGGISFFVIFLITFIILNIINNIVPLHFSNLKIVGILTVCTMAFLMGLADDAYNTKPLLKFIVQLVCGLILYFTNTKISIFSSEALNFSFTLFWIIGLMNSINMLDNMDAITTTVSIVILFFVIALNLQLNSIFNAVSILSIGTLGALLGFLIYNWHPAKMFMGDTGSQLLGVFLAVIGIDYCWNSVALVGNSVVSFNGVIIGFVVTAAVFILPLVDTATVFINRIKSGRSPFIGGKDHTTHHLFFKGITEKRIAILFFALQFIGVGLAFKLITNYSIFMLISTISYCCLVFVTLYLNTVIKRK